MAENTTGKPYYIALEKGDKQLRVFDDFNPNDLFWHRDKENRIVELIDGEVELQLEDCIPIKMLKGVGYEIPAETYHRVISNKKFSILLTLL